MSHLDTPSPSPGGEFSAVIADELATMVMRAQAFTSATGAAIALTEGDEMICRACSGTTAPDIGMHLSIEGSFTGLAVTTGQALRCDDSETDSRVDAAACRMMNTRSMCVVPVRDRGKVAGVLAVFSSNGHAFSDYHLAVLKTMADGISQSLERGRAPASTLHAAGPAPAVLPVHTPPPARPGVPQTGTAAHPSMAKAATAAAPVAKKIDTPAPVPKKIETPPPIRKIPTPVPVSRKEEAKPKPREERAAGERHEAVAKDVVSFGERSSIFATSPAAESGGKNRILFVGGAVALVVVVVVLWVVFSGPKTAAAPTSAVAATAAPADPQPAAAQSASATPEAAAAPTTVTTQTLTLASAAVAKPQPVTTSALVTETPQKPVPQAVRIEGGAAPVRNANVGEVAAPQLSMPVGNAPALPSLGASPVVPTLRRVVVPPQVMRRVNPVYPSTARSLRLEGEVILEVNISKTGSVTETRAISGPPLLGEAARDAVREWKYKPQTVNGEPTESVTRVVIRFQVPR